MQSLTLTKQTITDIRQDMIQIAKMRVDSEESVLHFEKINEISRIHENFVETQKFIDNFRNMHDELKEIKQLLVVDMREQGGSMPNLLTVHYYLSQLRDVQDSAVHYASQSTEDVKRTIQKHFMPLEETVEMFDKVLLETIAENLLDIIRSGDPSLVVRAAKIVDAEEKQDLATKIVEEIQEDAENKTTAAVGKVTRQSIVGIEGAALQNKIRRSVIGQKSSGPFDLSRDMINNSNTVTSTTTTTTATTTTVATTTSTVSPHQNVKTLMGSIKQIHRIRRNYPDRFFEALKKSVHTLFEGCYEAFQGNPDEILDNLNWIYSDLDMIRDDLIKCMPARWNIYEKFVVFYHKELYALLNRILDTEPNALIILKILNYVNDYYETMKTQLDVPRDPLLTPPLLDGKEDKLFDDYLALIVSKLREWKVNLGSSEKVNFIERAVPPEMDDENKLGMQGEVIMFSIISQQVDVAAESGQARILLGTVEECGSILKERQESWEATMREQVQLQINDPTDGKSESSVPGGLVEYLIALANDQIKGADYAEALSGKTAEMVSKKYRAQVISTWDFVSDGFINLAKACIAGLISIIFHDLIPPFQDLFAKSVWYKGRPVKQITDTIAEYISDSKTHLNPIIFDVFLDDVLDETLIKYLGALQNNNVSLSVPKSTDQIKKDIEGLYVLFSQHYPDAQEGMNHVQSQFRVFEHLLSTLESDISELPDVFLRLRHDFWDASLELFEAMVKSRKDVDNKIALEIIASVRNQALHQSEQPAEHQQPTYLSQFGKVR